MSGSLYYVKWEDVKRGHMRLASSPTEVLYIEDDFTVRSVTDVLNLRGKHGKGVCYKYSDGRWGKYFWFEGGMTKNLKYKSLALSEVPKTLRALQLIGA